MAAVQKPIPPEDIKPKDHQPNALDAKAKKGEDELSDEDKRLQVYYKLQAYLRDM